MIEITLQQRYPLEKCVFLPNYTNTTVVLLYIIHRLGQSFYFCYCKVVKLLVLSMELIKSGKQNRITVME